VQCVAVYRSVFNVWCCSVLQCVAVCCSVLQCVALYRSVLRVAYHCRSFSAWRSFYSGYFAKRDLHDQPSYECSLTCNILHHTASHCNTLQHTATQQYNATHCSTAIHCNTLQHQTLNTQCSPPCACLAAP